MKTFNDIKIKVLTSKEIERRRLKARPYNEVRDELAKRFKIAWENLAK